MNRQQRQDISLATRIGTFHLLPTMKYALFRWVLPRVGYEPFTIRNLAEKAWPTVAALTALQDYSGWIETVGESDHDDDGSDLLTRYAKASKPVVLKGYGRRCSVTSWTLETLKSEMGRHEVPVKIGDYVAEFGRPQTRKMRLGDFIDSLASNADSLYRDRLVGGLGAYVADVRLPVLADRLPRPRFFSEPSSDLSQKVRQDIITFWLGSRGAGTPLHCHHFGDVLVFQLIGRRSFTLVPPHQAPFIGYVPHTLNIGTAVFDPYAPDRERFPALDLIHRLECELEAGDALLIPGFWFHATQLSAPSFSASAFRRSRMPASIGGGPPGPWESGAYHRGW